ncbi:hypothetical protein LB516_24075 [Mesorhizobium sp. CO1-1-7]|uniref:hypothetical protein n=1 Tax=Mesorhizobium sp. CO1-1-7 TaxID=2876632 RepID=UPI001CD05F22|nr:hypothetical protein [Mesorhizobium sp. CO1-1-7]MBZ9748313.1 hypothetical protein [Mesorhizobium sp. CO1-1-7]
MIRRPRHLVNAPDVLADVGSPAAAERQAAHEYYNALPLPTASMTFSAYGNDEVKHRLNELFNYKCAYCETDFGPGMPVDVEHFRPKGRVVGPAGNLLFPGYWWLASTWANLLPSCIDCNRGRWHQLDGSHYKYGKENLFPLKGGAMPATTPAAVATEEPLLIDPAAEDPAAHLNHVYKQSPSGRSESVVEPTIGALGAEDPRGRASIEIYGLNRPRLAYSRKRMIERMKSAIDNVELLYSLADDEDHQAKKDRLKENGRLALNQIVRDYLHWMNPYAASCRAYFRKWLEDFRSNGSAP